MANILQIFWEKWFPSTTECGCSQSSWCTVCRFFLSWYMSPWSGVVVCGICATLFATDVFNYVVYDFIHAGATVELDQAITPLILILVRFWMFWFIKCNTWANNHEPKNSNLGIVIRFDGVTFNFPINMKHFAASLDTAMRKYIKAAYAASEVRTNRKSV